MSIPGRLRGVSSPVHVVREWISKEVQVTSSTLSPPWKLALPGGSEPPHARTWAPPHAGTTHPLPLLPACCAGCSVRLCSAALREAVSFEAISSFVKTSSGCNAVLWVGSWKKGRISGEKQ